MTGEPFLGDHLVPEMRKYLSIEGGKRLYDSWNEIWVPTSKTREAFRTLEECMRSAPSTKPRGLILTGDADTGKSRTMEAFLKAHPPRTTDLTEYAQFPAIRVHAPDTPSRTALMKSILAEIGYPISFNPSEEDLRRYTVKMIHECGIGTILIDELHDIQREYLSNKVVEFLRFLKSLINETRRPFVVSGTPIVLELISSDAQIAGRLNRVIRLEPLKLEEFAKTVLSFEKLMPLRQRSNLKDNGPAMQLLFMKSGGYIGRLSYLLQDACQVAIDSKVERITLDVLESVKDRSIAAVGRRAA